MIEIEGAIIKEVTLDRVAGTVEKSECKSLSFDVASEEETNVLKRLFLKPFVAHTETTEFAHSVDLSYNVLFNISKDIFGGEDFVAQSDKIAQYLISVSTHPNIKDGELFMVKYDDLRVGNQYLEGLGIYKFEQKEGFIETTFQGESIVSNFRKGLGSKKPDKACLILFDDEPFTILTIDSSKKETDYWQNDFIQHQPKKDHVNSTNNMLTLTKNYIATNLAEEFEVTKADQIDLLNRSADYFKTHDTFEKNEFEEEVFAENDLIDSFRKFENTFGEENELEVVENFEISKQAVKKQMRNFKSVLKLDKNFHVYIHGDKSLIEKGVDQDGRKFYKIYYKEEN